MQEDIVDFNSGANFIKLFQVNGQMEQWTSFSIGVSYRNVQSTVGVSWTPTWTGTEDLSAVIVAVEIGAAATSTKQPASASLALAGPAPTLAATGIQALAPASSSLACVGAAPSCIISSTLATSLLPSSVGPYISLSNSNLTVTCFEPANTNVFTSVRSTTAKSTGKKYFEVNIDAYNVVSGGTIASIPLGNFTLDMGTNTSSGGAAAGNADGTTTGWTTSGWTVLQYWFYFPSSQYYQFQIPAYTSAVQPAPYNSMMIYIDQLQIPAGPGSTLNNNWFSQFITNTSPSQPYTYGYYTGSSGVPAGLPQGCPVTAGWHSIQITLMTNQYYGSGAALGAASVHADRLNIIATGVALPDEPSPQNRNPAQLPLSSYHFVNTPLGAGAQWSSHSAMAAITSLSFNIQSFSENQWKGNALSPVTIISSSDTLQCPTPSVNLSYPVHCPPGADPSFGSDGAVAMIDPINPRYRYGGFGTVLASPAKISLYRGGAFDNYNLNHAQPQSLATFGWITQADLDSGVIAHRLFGGCNFANFARAYQGVSQTSEWSGLPWPACESDYNWNSAYGGSGNTGTIPYGCVVGIPASVPMPGGMSAGAQMLWKAFQNYGCYLNVQVGGVGNITVYGEGSINGDIANQLSSAFGNILANLCIMTNAQPIIQGQGFGGGTPLVSLLPGLLPISNYPSIGLPPYAIPTNPPFTPIPMGFKNSKSNWAPNSAGSLVSQIGAPAGSFVVIAIYVNQPGNFTWTGISDTAGNSYQLIQPSPGSAYNQLLLAYCPRTVGTITSSTSWTANESAYASYWGIFGGFYIPASGTATLVGSNTGTGSGQSFSLSATAGAQIYVGFASVVNGYGTWVEPSGWTPYTYDGINSLDYSFISNTYAPSWNQSSSPFTAMIAGFSNV